MRISLTEDQDFALRQSHEIMARAFPEKTFRLWPTLSPAADGLSTTYNVVWEVTGPEPEFLHVTPDGVAVTMDYLEPV